MLPLEQITKGTRITGLNGTTPVTILDAQWHGSAALEVTYKDDVGHVSQQLLYRDKEADLHLETEGLPWSFDGDGALLRLVSEAYRIHLAYLFDPLLAVHTSLIDPLPHQITAVYEEMLRRQPLRYLLADDPGAGKTIMAGLLIKELRVRGDVERCLIVTPGSLVEQWQDELWRRFHMLFDILTSDQSEAAATGNWFQEHPLAIIRLDHLSRSEPLQAKLQHADWDLVIVDEAHKMSATYFGGEVKYTKRYRLGQLLSRTSRHFLLMTATPHNGKEADFQLFMALLDGDRFEGKPRDGAHTVDVSDLMRRLVKEKLVKFDNTPLFPERRAYTVTYTLSNLEAGLYRAVTDYVRQEFNRAESLESGRKGTVGFALTMLQRRLASSPEAIYQSLRRRRERLESRLRDEEIRRRGGEALLGSFLSEPVEMDEDAYEDLPADEQETQIETVVDQATAAQTIQELHVEIDILRGLERMADAVRQSGQDRKWDEVSRLLQDEPKMFDGDRHRRKLVIFTEHRDTLTYLAARIRAVLGRPDAVVTIQGGMGREERHKAQELFTQDKSVEVLIATDAAGEGINLQRAHLMINYDLPWNPNRLEQRFGRIHRIGQTEVCHLWNLVAHETREGDVYALLLKKLEEEREALGGQVFDVLGKVTFGDRPLRDLLVEAIRYGDRPDVKERLHQAVAAAWDREHLAKLLAQHALVPDTLDATMVSRIRGDMERAEARRLQPHYIADFFLAAFPLLGGSIRERESGRYEITHVPAVIRQRDREIGRGAPVLTRYERVTFEKRLISVAGKALADFIAPGHPLLDATVDMVLERYRNLLKRGAMLVDPEDAGETPRILVYLEHRIEDGRALTSGDRRTISQRLEFVELDADGTGRSAGNAPYLDYHPVPDELREAIEQHVPTWSRAALEQQALNFAIANLVPEHIEEVRNNRLPLIQKARVAVHARLTKEMVYWDHRAATLQTQAAAGRPNAHVNAERALQRYHDLELRLQRRMTELDREEQIAPLPPVILGAALIIPQGLVRRLIQQDTEPSVPDWAVARDAVERMAMTAVMEWERKLGHDPRDVSAEKCGYDIESRDAGTGRLRLIEVKGRVEGAATVTVTKNEILTARNKPDDFILAIVEVTRAGASTPVYIRGAFEHEPDFAVASVNFHLPALLAKGDQPA